MDIAIIGTGNVGKNIGAGLLRAGHNVTYGSRDPTKTTVPSGASVAAVPEAAEKSEVIFLAVPYSAMDETLSRLKQAKMEGKTIVDVSNNLDQNMELASGFSTSGAEEIAKKLPEANVVKAFNTVFAENMSEGKVKGEKLTAFIASDNADAKQKVKQLAEQIGFDSVDAGNLRAARYLEPMAALQIKLAFGMKLGKQIGLKLVK